MVAEGLKFVKLNSMIHCLVFHSDADSGVHLFIHLFTPCAHLLSSFFAQHQAPRHTLRIHRLWPESSESSSSGGEGRVPRKQFLVNTEGVPVEG